MASTAADELTTILGVDLAKDAMAKIGAMQKGLTTLRSTVMGLSAVFTGVAAASDFFTNRVGGDAEGLKTLADKTGLSTDALQEWRYAAESMGAGAGTIEKDLEGLQKKFLMTGKSAEQTLLDLADRMKGMSGPQARRLGEAYGLSDDTIKLLRQGKDGIAALRAEAVKMGHVIPPEDLERASALNKDVRGLTMNLRAMATQALLGVVPAFSGMVAQAKAWVETNREWLSLRITEATQGIVDGFQTFMDVLGDLKKKYLDPLLERMDPFMDNLGGWKQVISDLVSGALLGLLLILALLAAKVMAAAGGILLLSAAFNDLLVYVKGGDSAIGRFFKAFEDRWPALFGAVKKIGAFFKDNIFPVLEGGWKIVKTFGGIVASVFDVVLDRINSLAGPLVDFVSTFTERFPGITAAVTAVADVITGVLGYAVQAVANDVKVVIDVFYDLLETVGSVIDSAFKIIEAFGQWVVAFFTGNFDEAAKQSAVIFSSLGDMIGAAFKGVASAVVKLFKHMLSSITNLLPDFVKNKLGLGDITIAAEQAAAVQSLNAVPMNQNVVNNSRSAQSHDNRQISITQNISGGDPQAIGQATAGAVSQPPHYAHNAVSA